MKHITYMFTMQYPNYCSTRIPYCSHGYAIDAILPVWTFILWRIRKDFNLVLKFVCILYALNNFTKHLWGGTVYNVFCKRKIHYLCVYIMLHCLPNHYDIQNAGYFRELIQGTITLLWLHRKPDSNLLVIKKIINLLTWVGRNGKLTSFKVERN